MHKYAVQLNTPLGFPDATEGRSTARDSQEKKDDMNIFLPAKRTKHFRQLLSAMCLLHKIRFTLFTIVLFEAIVKRTAAPAFNYFVIKM
jgi:hypothetical protein